MAKKRQPSAPSVWVVEERGNKSEWRPVDLVVGRPQFKLDEWRASYPHRKYRLTRYVSPRTVGAMRG